MAVVIAWCRTTPLRLGKRDFMRHAPPVDEMGMVDDERHESGRCRIAESEIAAVFRSQGCRVRIAAACKVVDEVEHVLSQHERRTELRVVRTPERMVGLVPGQGARAELTVADERRGSEDVADGRQQM